MFPVARTEKLTVRELPDETLVFDHETNKAHCLNLASALVWKHCDGKTNVGGLTRILRDRLNVPNSAALVGLALEQLSRRHLLLEEVAPLAGPARLSRRDILRQLAAAAVAMPVVMTLTATNASARNHWSQVNCGRAGDNYPCFPFGTTSPGACCGGVCKINTGQYLNDVLNCGSCGNKCAAGQTCAAGVCTGTSSGGGGDDTLPNGNGPDRISGR